MVLIHATTVAIEGRGVLLRGPAGAGKSDLALRLIEGGALLVADDQTQVTLKEGRLIAQSPASIRGIIEVRGIGLVRVEVADSAPLELVIDLLSQEKIERLPRPATCNILGNEVPCRRLAAFEPSAPAKVRLAVGVGCGNIMPTS
jgi:serine kinase of HPr protein (carbohydrate metabolism regulator)